MIMFALLAAAHGGHPGDPVFAYKTCLAPIVIANEKAGANHKSLEEVLRLIAVRCAKQRERAADELFGLIVEATPDLRPPPSEADKEALIQESTVRWANDVVAGMVGEEQ